MEDLVALLLAAKARWPALGGVSAGAVASDYQRLRVESAAARAGLASLAPLWRLPQRALLRRMLRRGVEAVLVKVACLGLSPARDLGMSLSEAEPRLLRLADAHGVSCMGEGGEYESLVLDCPGLFARGRVVLEGLERPGGGDGTAGEAGL